MDFQQTTSKALHGEQLDGELSQLIEHARSRLEQKRQAVDQAIANALKLKSQLPPVSEFVCPSAQDLLIRAEQNLALSREKITETKQVLRSFHIRHGRIELPKQPSALQSALACGVAALIESGVNASFFLNAHLSASAASALLTSTLISATNVFVCASAGYFFGRWMAWGKLAPDANAPEFSLKRYAAKALVIGFSGLMGFFHLSVGAIRSQESLHDISHSLATYVDVFTTPESLFLVMAGACMSLFSFYKGVNGFDDPYPHYGAVAHAVEEARDELEDHFEQSCDDVRERFDEALDSAQKQLRTQSKDIERYNQAVNQCVAADGALRSEIATAQTHLRSEVTKLVSFFSAVRNTRVSLSDAQLDALSDLSAELDYTLPAFIHLPSLEGFQRQCTHAQEAALQRLASLFQSQQEH